MGKAEIIEDLGAGQYTIRRVYAGRDAAQAKVVLINTNIATLRSQYSTMPESTEDEIFTKHIVKLKITSLEKQVEYILNNFPEDIEVDAYCADYTEDLSGEVGTIDIPGEVTELVNIRPGHGAAAVFDAERDGEFWPSIAVGPWTCFLNKCILPGWQKWYPKYRYGWIVPGSINYDDNTCAVTIQPAYSSQQDLDVNQGDGFGGEIVDEEIELEYFKQDAATANPGFADFCERNPDHPICNVSELAPPVEISDEQWAELNEINNFVDYNYSYENDQSGYEIGDYWNPMYDLGAEWETIPGLIWPDGSPMYGPPITRDGDCEDYVLTKMQAIIEKGIVPAANLQVVLCYVDGGYHAVLGLQTTNRGFLIMDQRDYGVIYEKSVLDRTHRWESFSVAGTVWATVQRLKGEVPIEYMGCNAEAFADEDEVVIQFLENDWLDARVIGFRESPVICSKSYIFPTYTSARWLDGATIAYTYTRDTWETYAAYVPAADRVQYGATGESGIGLSVCGQTASEHLDRYHLDDLYLYDSSLNIWELGRSHIDKKSNLGFRSLKNGRSIITGGQYTETTVDPPCWWYAKIIFNSTYEYLMSADAWSNRNAGPAVYYHADFQINGKLYVAGGTTGGWDDCWGDLAYLAVSKETRQFDNALDAWASMQGLPYMFGQVRGWNLNGEGFIGGGALTAEKVHESDSKDFQAIPIGFWPYYNSSGNFSYNAQSDTWTQKSKSQGGMGGFSASECLGEAVCLRAGAWGGGREYYLYVGASDTWVSGGNIMEVAEPIRHDLSVLHGGGAEL